MITLAETETFAAWLAGLRDGTARARVQRRLDRLRLGNPGDVRPVGEGVSEMRIDYGPGYRVYYLQKARCSSCSWPEATSVPSAGISQRQSGSRMR